jgi:hypothetical protein
MHDVGGAVLLSIGEGAAAGGEIRDLHRSDNSHSADL